jgi:oxamate amidohydrolase
VSTISVAVAAPHDDAVSAAEDAVRAGGNALDAALAAAAVLAVTYPHQCSLGGDLTALVRLPDNGRVLAVLSIGAAARTVDARALSEATPKMPDQGPLTVTVPGVAAGWLALAGLGSRLGLGRPLRYAAAVAAAGAKVSPGLARAISARWKTIVSDPGLNSVFSTGGRPLGAGEDFMQPALAATLLDLAEDPGSLYTGSVGASLAAGLTELGSPLTASDLEAHAVEHAQPLNLSVSGASWWAPPPPAQGATALALIDDRDARDLLTRARAAHAARNRLLGDPRHGPIDVDGMLRPSSGLAATAAGHGAGDTVAVTAVDNTGRSVALIQSLFEWFGAGLLEPRTGIVLHNRGAAFVLDPNDRHPGRLRAGARPPHTLCPLLAEAGALRVAIGCQGGRLQPLILAQVADQATDALADIQAAISAPRWVLGGGELNMDTEYVLREPGADPPAVADVPVITAAALDDRCGHVQVARAIGTRLEAASDPRADGRGIVVVGAA